MREKPKVGGRRTGPRNRSEQRRSRALADALDPRNWMIQALEARVMLTADLTGVPVWTQVGPAGMRGGQSLNTSIDSASGPNAVSGAVTSILIDPMVTAGSVMLIGTTDGGIW